MNYIEGKIILVTGAARGLGAAIVKTLAAEGGVVLLTDVDPASLEKTETEIKDAGGSARSFVMDVMEESSVEEVILKAIEVYGRIDILVNNAGVDVTKSVEELEVKEWDHVLNVNLRGPYLTSRTIFPYMQKQGGGHIVNVVSTACKRAWTNASAYHASKWGLLGFTHALHVEARLHGIKVTAVVAGGMRTPFIFDRFPETDPNCLQDPANVADTIRYVLSQPAETVIPEVMVIPMRETSWP